MLNKIIKLSIILVVLLIGFSVFYYLVIFPSKKGNDEQLITLGESENITQEEIKEVLKSIVNLECLYDEDGDGQWDDEVYGSGTFIYKDLIKGESPDKAFDYHDAYVLTNGHVAQLKEITKEGYNFNFCSVFLNTIQGEHGSYLGQYIYDTKNHFLDDELDIALLKYGDILHGEKIEGRPSMPDDILESVLLKNFPFCPEDKIIGSRVYIFGYPGAAFEYMTPENVKEKFPFIPEEYVTNEPILSERNLIVSDGIISGIDSYGDYYTNAKIDAGMSGGLVISKMNGEVCIVGVPTWVSEGAYENLGMIQPIQKIIGKLKTIELP